VAVTVQQREAIKNWYSNRSYTSLAVQTVDDIGGKMKGEWLPGYLGEMEGWGF